jgi:vitamin B12 transporter
MRCTLMIILALIYTGTVTGQTHISGSICNKKGEPVLGANIYFEGTFEGTTSDRAGQFNLTTNLTGEKTLIVSYIGYESYSQLLLLKDDPITLAITLKENKTDLGEVVITAGTFAASDENKSAVLNTLDMATSSGGFGDIAGAISSLPGTSNAGEEGGLLVRGGERYETATFIDGMVADNAFTAKLPDVPVRGRFSPMLFRGTVFSTGGYSAEYGQALSSALILNTIGMPKKDETYFSLHSSGIYAACTKKWDRTAFSTTTSYTNTLPFYSLVNSNIKWQHAPESLGENLVYRQKTGRNGMLKAMGAYSYDKSALYYRNLNSDKDDLYTLKNHNCFAIVSYTDQLGENWILHSGISLGYDDLDMGISDTANLVTKKKTTELKLSMSGPVFRDVSLNIGGNFNLKDLDRNYISLPEEKSFPNNFVSSISALYAEAEIRVTKRISSRIGARFEALSLSRETSLSPRLALACKTSKFSQISLGYGQFRQQAQDDWLIYNNSLKPEKAEHFIANFQYTRNSRIFRIEAYYKNYDRLIKYDYLYAIEASAYNNNGQGYAQGIDIFFRDQKTLKNGDIWVSYSLMDSKRNYRDYICSLIPSYISRHNLSIAYKHYIDLTDSYISLGYNYSSSRPYIDPNVGMEVQQKTKAFHDLGISIFHFTELFGKFTMLYAQVTNVLGTDHIYGYRFASIPDENGMYRSQPILPVTKRFFLVGVHISFTGQTDI